MLKTHSSGSSETVPETNLLLVLSPRLETTGTTALLDLNVILGLIL